MKRMLNLLLLLIGVLVVLIFSSGNEWFKNFIAEIKSPDRLDKTPAAPQQRINPAAEFDPIDWETFNKNGRAWRKNELLTSYELYGTHSPEWDVQALTFFENYAALYFTGWKDAEKNQQVLAQANELIEMGCDDPYILFLHGQLTYFYGDAVKGHDILSKSLALLENSDYPAFCKFLAAQNLQGAHEWAGMHSAYIQETKRKKMVYLGRAAGDTSFGDGNQRFYMAALFDIWKGRNCEMPEDAELLLYELDNTPGADPWIKLIVQGLYHTGRGWEARGGKVSKFIKENQWEVFRNEIQQARDCFTRAHELHPEFPEAASKMITIAMSDGSTEREQRQWFDRSVAAHFDYMDSYENYFWALRPRWGGSHQQMLQLGVECLNTGRFDTAVPPLFLRALWDVGSELPDWRTPFRAPGTFENLQAFFNGTINEPKQADYRYYWQTIEGILYWAAGHYAESRAVFDKLGDNLYLPGFQSYLVTKKKVFGEVNLHTSPFRDLAFLAEALYSDNFSLEALQLYETLRKNLQSDPYALHHINSRIATLTLKTDYLKGGWVDLIPAADLAGWAIKGGSWEVEADGTLKGTSDENSTEVLLLGQFPVTGNYEMRCEIETSLKAAILMGYTKGTMGREFVSFTINTRKKRAYLSDVFSYSPDALNKSIEPLETNHVLVRVKNGLITAFVNDEEIITEQIPDYRNYSLHNGLFGVGQYYGRTPGHYIRYRNLQIRKID